MSAGQWDALRAASQQDSDLQQAWAGAQSAEELVAIANQRGFEISVEDLPSGAPGNGELSDAQLEAVSGGTIGMGITNIECQPTGWCSVAASIETTAAHPGLNAGPPNRTLSGTDREPVARSTVSELLLVATRVAPLILAWGRTHEGDHPQQREFGVIQWRARRDSNP